MDALTHRYREALALMRERAEAAEARALPDTTLYYLIERYDPLEGWVELYRYAGRQAALDAVARLALERPELTLGTLRVLHLALVEGAL